MAIASGEGLPKRLRAQPEKSMVNAAPSMAAVHGRGGKTKESPGAEKLSGVFVGRGRSLHLNRFSVNRSFFRPLQLQGWDQLAGGVEYPVLGVQSFVIGCNQLAGRVDALSFSVKDVEQGTLADIPLLGICIRGVGGKLEALLEVADLLSWQLHGLAKTAAWIQSPDDGCGC
jgi:hypothetical protein